MKIDEEAEGPNPPRRPFPVRVVVYAACAVAALAALAVAAASVRSCSEGISRGLRTEAVERIYEYGSSISKDARIVLASKRSGFVIPRDIVKRLILGLSSTASVQIACQAQIDYFIRSDELLAAKPSWSGRTLTLRLPPPEAARPIIETSTIKRAILDRGFLIDEGAELDRLLSELSDRVAGSPDAALDDATAETCRSSLEELCSTALASGGKKGVEVKVEWAAKVASR